MSRLAALPALFFAALAPAIGCATEDIGPIEPAPDPPVRSASSALSSGPDVLTHRNDAARTAQNNAEAALTLSNVTAATFGLRMVLPVDGQVFAQPLYKGAVALGSAVRNVLFVATAHDSVYAFDADTGATLWHVSFLAPPSVTSVPYTDTGAEDIVPEVGILSTPVIDPSTNTLYVVAKTEENGVQLFRLHALDIATGADRVPSVILQPTFPGTAGDGTNGQLALDAAMHQQRVGLLLLHGIVYVAFGASGDNFPWHGWLVGYRTADLSQATVWNSTPNGVAGGFWSSGEAPAADASGNLFLPTGNGDFDGVANFGSAVVKLSTTAGLAVADYFTPFNASQLSDEDLDVGSGGVILLPDVAGTAAHPHLLAASDKAGTLWLLDRDMLGGFSPSRSNPDAQIVQEIFDALGDTPIDNTADPLPFVDDNYSTPAYWRDAAGVDHLYWGGVNDALKMFNLTNGRLSTSPVSRSSAIYPFPGASPCISSHGNRDGILWAVRNAFGHAVLHAYDATDLAAELYTSDQAGTRDALGLATKFVVPTVTNGKVYVGTQGAVAVFGLFAPTAPVPAAPRGAVWLCALGLLACGLRAAKRPC
jgi:hypothetical protein